MFPLGWHHQKHSPPRHGPTTGAIVSVDDRPRVKRATRLAEVALLDDARSGRPLLHTLQQRLRPVVATIPADAIVGVAPMLARSGTSAVSARALARRAKRSPERDSPAARSQSVPHAKGMPRRSSCQRTGCLPEPSPRTISRFRNYMASE